MFSRETLQRLNSFHTQVARAPVDKEGWARWVMIYPFINDDQIIARFNSGDNLVQTEKFLVPALAPGLPPRPSWRLKTDDEWIEPYWCFRVRCFETEQRIFDECQICLDGDEAFMVDVIDEVTPLLDQVGDILSSLGINSESLDYVGEDFPF